MRMTNARSGSPRRALVVVSALAATTAMISSGAVPVDTGVVTAAGAVTVSAGANGPQDAARVYCPVCGAGNRAGSRFCQKDGSALPQIDPARYVPGFVRASETYSSEEVQQTIHRASASVVRIYAALDRDVLFPIVRGGSGTCGRGGYLSSYEEGGRSAGSGFVISDRGEVVTNAHVASPFGTNPKLTVETMDGRKFPATTIGVDVASDLALLKIDTVSIPPLAWGDERTLHLGEETWAVGNPLDIGISLTRGTISTVGRMRMGLNQVESYIHSDAYITHGNSGGPLLDVKGAVVGVSAMGFHETKGQGYSIPATMTRIVVEKLREDGVYDRGFVGLHVTQIGSEEVERFSLKRTRGVVVESVLPDTPAAAAGFRPGDVLFGINGRLTLSGYLLQEVVSVIGPDRRLEITFDRGGRTHQLPVVSGVRPAEPRIDPILQIESLLMVRLEEDPDGDGIMIRVPNRYSIAPGCGLREGTVFRYVLPAGDWPLADGKSKRNWEKSTRPAEVLTLDDLRTALERSYLGGRIGVRFILDLKRRNTIWVAFDEFRHTII